MPRTFIACTLLLSLFLTACDSNSSGDDQEGSTLVLRLSGAEPLTNGFHYEGWALVGSVAGATNVSTGKFNLDADGNAVDLNGNLIAGSAFATNIDLNQAASIFITIEPPGDTDQTPSPASFLGGDLVNGEAALTVEHSEGIGRSMQLASGTFILATPTDGPDTNEDSGLWFMNLTAGAPGRGLTLPNLPVGWTYEGWVVIDGIPVSTGTFRSVTDGDDAAPHSGPEEGFAFPGEDFLTNAPAGLSFPTFLVGSTAVVSIEPSPDSDAAPFALKLLQGPVPGGATPGVTYPLTNNAAAFPTATARIR